jgi:hypothetical protein
MVYGNHTTHLSVDLTSRSTPKRNMWRLFPRCTDHVPVPHEYVGRLSFVLEWKTRCFNWGFMWFLSPFQRNADIVPRLPSRYVKKILRKQRNEQKMNDLKFTDAESSVDIAAPSTSTDWLSLSDSAHLSSFQHSTVYLLVFRHWALSPAAEYL